MDRRALLICGAAAGWSLTGVRSPSAAVLQVSLPPAPDGPVLQIGRGETGRMLGRQEIEALGLHRVVTTTPWETGTFTFEGVLFRDLLRLAGLDTAPAVVVRAIDNYSQLVPAEDWRDWPLLLATREQGRPLTRRTQGPGRLVYPLLDHPELDDVERKPRWVWLIKSIEPAEA